MSRQPRGENFEKGIVVNSGQSVRKKSVDFEEM